jgi:hypothetical protein
VVCRDTDGRCGWNLRLRLYINCVEANRQGGSGLLHLQKTRPQKKEKTLIQFMQASDYWVVTQILPHRHFETGGAIPSGKTSRFEVQNEDSNA